LPHSDIHGSTPARGSPWLFAACHVLHRLLVPRHPPNALLALEIRSVMHGSKPSLASTNRSLSTDAVQPKPVAPVHTPLNAIAAAGRVAPIRSDKRNGARPETHQIRFTVTKNTPSRANETTETAAPRKPRRHAVSCRKPLASFSDPAPLLAGRQPCLRRAEALPLHSAGDQSPAPSMDEGPGPQAPAFPMETIGFEPTTPCLQSRCSPS
jgi:hypothetical protein